MKEFKELYKIRNRMEYMNHGIRPDNFDENDDEDTVSAICKSNIFKLNIANDIIKLLRNDSLEMRTSFIKLKLVEIDSKNALSGVYALTKHLMEELELEDFVRALDHTTFFKQHYKHIKDKAYYEIRQEAEDENISFMEAGLRMIERTLEKVTEVFFLKDIDGEITAVFAGTLDKNNMMDAYAHIGQHTQASVGYVEECLEADPEEYAELKKEMEEVVGYKLRVISRLPKSKDWNITLTYNEALFCVINSICNVMGKTDDELWTELSMENEDVDFDQSDEKFSPYFTMDCCEYAASCSEQDISKIKKELKSERMIEFLKKIKGVE